MSKPTSPAPIFEPAFDRASIIIDPKFNTREPSEYTKKDPDFLALYNSISAIGFDPGEPVIISRDPKTGKSYLDAGFRRTYVAGMLDLKKIPALVYERSINDPARRDSNARENAVKLLSWRSLAMLIKIYLEKKMNPEDIAHRVGRHPTHVKLVASVYEKLSEIPNEEIASKELMQLSFEEASELVRFPKAGRIAAWNHFVEHGVFPSREKRAGGGRATKDGTFGKKKAVAELINACPWIEWSVFVENFPPKTPQQVAQIVACVSKFRREADGFDYRRAVEIVSRGANGPALT